MKIEIGESLGYSFLRHVKQCWLVQANWKASEHWAKRQAEEDLERLFSDMRENFDPDGSVFKGTTTVGQFLRQGEIDVVGVGQDGSIHAVEVAFHEAGLNYTGGAANRVLKKLLRTMFVLDAYHPAEAEKHIYFLSPKVHRAVREPLEEIFGALQGEYPEVDWHLLTNQEFTGQVLVPTLEKAGSVADTSELFVRSAKLLELAGGPSPLVEEAQHWQKGQTVYGNPRRTVRESTSSNNGRIQPLVQSLMKTLLEEYPDLLSENDRRNVMDRGYCKSRLGLELGGFALLRRREDGRFVSDRARYWKKVYAGRYYVTNHWFKQYHHHNGGRLIRFVEQLIDRRAGHPGLAALEKHRAAFQKYLEHPA